MPLAESQSINFDGWSVTGVKQCNRWHHISGRSFVAASNVVYLDENKHVFGEHY